MKGTLIILLTLVIVFSSGFTQENIKSVKAVKTKSPQIDGVFHDSEWNMGGLATNFVQREPKEGVPASEKTEAYFLYDAENLYVGVKCYDKSPDKIMSRIAGRDNIGAADYLEIMLDTFHDHRNGYFFGTTPAGTKIDGQYSNDGEEDTSWDGVWWVETGKTDFGWFAEFKIPFTTLKFPKKKVNIWGLNLFRIIERKKESLFWQEVTRDEGFKVSNFGHLKNLRGIEPGMNLQVKPYLTNAFKDDRTSQLKVNNQNGFTGIDIRYGLTTNLTTVMTVNPDYAQIEADEDRINLSRYPYILREKRPFFLEGGSLFNTAGNSMSDGEYRTALFYSRRINEPVYGLKTTGKIGNWNLGIIHCLNDNDIGIKEKIEEGELPQDIKAQAFYNVVRLNRDIFSRSQIGLIAMSKEYNGGYNREIGIDGRLRFPSNYTLSFEAVKSFIDRYSKKNHSLNIYFSHFSDFFKFSYWYQEQAPNFMGNEIGFYEYNDFRGFGTWMQLAPRIEKYGLRRMGNNINAWTENFWGSKYFDKTTLSRGWNYNFWMQTMNYWMFGAGRGDGKYYDRFDEVLYPNLSYWAWLRNNWSSKFNFSVNYSQGKYRTGYRWSYYSSFRVRPNNRFNVQLDYNRSFVKLLDEEAKKLEHIHYEVLRSKIYYYFNRDLNARFILQYNGMEKRLDTYYLLAYNFKPGSFLYIAYTERFDSDLYIDPKTGTEIEPKFGSSNKILQIKLSYLVQM